MHKITGWLKLIPYRDRIAKSWYVRAAALVAIGIVIIGVAIPMAQSISQERRYLVSGAASKMLGKVVPTLNQKLTYDNAQDLYQFNKNGEPSGENGNPTAQAQQQQVGANKSDEAHLYSADIPANLNRGITYYDNQQDVNFTLKPQFTTMNGQVKDGRLVYPLTHMAAQAVYTVQNNGLREDIVVNKSPNSGPIEFGYHLVLPDTLEARAIPGANSIGIYSADPSLFGNISYGSNADQSLVMNARRKSPKNYLVFTIPAPTIAQTSSKQSGVSANITLTSDSNVIVCVKGLNKNLTYPVDIDPSVVVNSSSTFAAGTNEGNIDLGTNQISRGALTGATLTGGWTDTANSFSSTYQRYYAGSAVYNGYIYLIDGRGPTVNWNDNLYAPINSDGTIGTWTETTNTTTSGTLQARYGVSTVAYNGYIYMMAGIDNSSVYHNDTWYAKLASNGSVGAWTQTNAFTTARYMAGAVTYNNNVYLFGGTNNTSYYATTQYATFNGDGTISAWTTSSATFNGGTGRSKMGIAEYNGYIYIAGGQHTSSLYDYDVWYTKIQANGDVSNWIQTTYFTTSSLTRHSVGLVAANGYLYVMGGNHDGTATQYADTFYAPIATNGATGAWTATTSITTARYAQAAFAYKGFIYNIAGGNAAGQMNDEQHAAIDSAGAVGAWASTTSITAARYSAAVVVFNSFVYVMGGQATNGGAGTSTIYVAPITAAGTIGAWATNTVTLPAAPTTASTTRYGMAAAAYNGHMYIMGGFDGTNYLTATYYATITAGTGVITAWTQDVSTDFVSGRAFAGAAAYNGYLYVMGGSNATTRFATVYKAAISNAGVPGAFASTSGFNNANGTAIRDGIAVAVYGGRVYATGGNTGSGVLTETQYASFNTDGTLTTWSIASTSFTTGRYKGAAGVSNGYLYVMGGSSTGSNYFNDVQYAPILSTGNLGSWTTSTAFTTGRWGMGGFAYNGNLYILGGIETGAAVGVDTWVAPINNGGSGADSTWTTATNNYGNGRYDHGAFAYNGNLYSIGGTDGSNYFTTNGTGTTGYAINYAVINADGTLGVWSRSATGLTKARIDFGLSIYNGYVYITGGAAFSGGTNYSDTQYMAISALTSTTVAGTWLTAAAVVNNAGTTTAVLGVRTVAYNGYLYSVGGSGTSYFSNVNVATLNSDGSTSTFVNTTSFPSAIAGYDMSLAVYNGYMYILGGYNDTNLFSNVYYAAINSNGTVGAWTAGPSMPIARYDGDSFAQNGYLYVMGGETNAAGTTYDAAVYSTPIASNGALGGWSTTVSMANGIAGLRAATYGGYLYTTGGADNSNNYGTSYTSLSAIARTGSYSTMVDLKAPATILSSLTYAGSVGSVTYQAAGANGVFGTSSSASSLNNPSCGYNQGTVRYVYIYVTMDDSMSGIFGDSTGSADTLTNLTLNYLYGRAPTTSRLRGGKYFSGETQLPLDTCGP